MSKIDQEFKRITNRILIEGVRDKNPRPKYTDGTPAHTISINHEMMTFDLSKNEFPILSLRPMPFKSAIGELLWIYQDTSNNLDLLKDKYNISWWDSWDIGDRTIGACYGETVRRHNLMHNLLDGLKNDPDGRRHIINLWQEDDFKDPHGLKPCCYQTVWNVRHSDDGKADYLDMCMFQRSCDWMVAASASNQIQYATFLCLVAHCLGYRPGRYTWFAANVQIYDRHLRQAYIMMNRDPIITSATIAPAIKINHEKHDFFDLTMDDIKLVGYNRDTIEKTNPQLKFELGV